MKPPYTEIEVPDGMSEWDFMKQRRKERKAKRMFEFDTVREEQLKNHPAVLDYERPEAWAVRFRLAGTEDHVMYYPSTAKWVLNNRVMNGNFESFMGWLDKRARHR